MGAVLAPRVVPTAGRLTLVDYERAGIVGLPAAKPRTVGEQLAVIVPELLAVIEPLTASWHSNAALVTRSLLRSVATGPAVRPTLQLLEVPESSVMSRFARAGLPSPKLQMMLFREWTACALWARGVHQVAPIAYVLNASSPQAFTRFIRQREGCAAVPFLEAWTPERFQLERLDPAMRWDDLRWRMVDPLDGTRHLGRRHGRQLAQLARAGVA
jgi:hypothetical protein